MTDTNKLTLATPSTESAPLPPKQEAMVSLVPLVFIFLILYVLVIRPQHKKLKAHNQLINGLKKGDKVVTSGGIIGTITNIKDNENIIDIEISSGVIIKVLRHSITDLSKTNSKPVKE